MYRVVTGMVMFALAVGSSNPALAGEKGKSKSRRPRSTSK